jgi:hypothetical protein
MKVLATILGIGYVLLGITGMFDTSLVGTNGLFAADPAYSIAFMVVGAVLLFAALFRQEASRGIIMTVGTLLALVALGGLLTMPNKGEMLGMLVNTTDHIANLVAGLALAGTAYFARRETRGLRATGYLRHAVQ